jgi:hypothetical protein
VNLQGAKLVTLRLQRTGGTVDGSSIEVEQLPADWLEVEPSEVVGATVRVVDGRAMELRPGVVRTDKTGTVVWHAKRP